MIEQTVANPAAIHTLELFLGVAGALILILLTIGGFWMSRWIDATDRLTEVIRKLEIHFAETQTTVDEIVKNCDTRCNQYGIKIEENAKAIHQLEIQLLTGKS